jgi:hypothetical protein
LIDRYGRIEQYPSHVLGDQLDLALLFKKLATLRTEHLFLSTLRYYVGKGRRMRSLASPNGPVRPT